MPSDASPTLIFLFVFFSLFVSNFLHLKHLSDLVKLLSDSAMRGRVYLPQDELAQFGLSDKDVFSRKVTNRWREFMKEQITRARFYFSLAEGGASQLDNASRWPV